MDMTNEQACIGCWFGLAQHCVLAFPANLLTRLDYEHSKSPQRIIFFLHGENGNPYNAPDAAIPPVAEYGDMLQPLKPDAN
jgi:hypothetical protein